MTSEDPAVSAPLTGVNNAACSSMGCGVKPAFPLVPTPLV